MPGGPSAQGRRRDSAPPGVMLGMTGAGTRCLGFGAGSSGPRR